jgi:hypothetical protein
MTDAMMGQLESVWCWWSEIVNSLVAVSSCLRVLCSAKPYAVKLLDVYPLKNPTMR